MEIPAKELEINTEYITLDAALKFSGVAQSGGEAKIYIIEGDVKVNGMPCTSRGKKLRAGDLIEVFGESFIIARTS